MTDEITYVYLICGPSRELRLQLRYSLATLIAECPEAAGRIVVYTDDPAAIAKLSRDVRIVDVRDDIREMTADWTYVYRAKPVVTADALQRFGGSCVFLDADSFFRPGFRADMQTWVRSGTALMNRFLCTDPYPGLRGFGCKLPSGRIWRYDPAVAHMHNSGIIGVNADHVPALLDAAALIDALHERRFVAGDLEQFAVSETLRLHDAEINENDTTFVHYYRHWRKSYMEARLAAAFASVAGEVLPCRPFIPLTKTRTRIHKRRTQAVVMFDAMRAQAAVAATRWNFQRRARRPMGEGLRAQS